VLLNKGLRNGHLLQFCISLLFNTALLGKQRVNLTL